MIEFPLLTKFLISFFNSDLTIIYQDDLKSLNDCFCAKLLPVCLTLCDLMACQAPLSKGFSREEYRSGLLCPPPGDLPNLGMESRSFMSICIGRQVFTTSATCFNINCRHCDVRMQLITCLLWRNYIYFLGSLICDNFHG